MQIRDTRFIGLNLGAARIDSGTDFSWTWEYFGRWRLNAKDIRQHVGGFRLPVVSQRVRSLIRKLKVRQVSFDPVFTLDSPGLVPW